MADQGSKAKIYARIKNRIKHHGRERERMADEGSQGKIYARLKKHIKHHRTRVLREVDDEQVSYMCGLCVTPGFGPRYDCTRCHLRIHHHCASRLQLSPPCFLHPDQHHMSLVVVGEGGLQCRACTGAIAGLHYQCTWHGLEARIHPLCARLRQLEQPSVLHGASDAVEAGVGEAGTSVLQRVSDAVEGVGKVLEVVLTVLGVR